MQYRFTLTALKFFVCWNRKFLTSTGPFSRTSKGWKFLEHGITSSTTTSYIHSCHLSPRIYTQPTPRLFPSLSGVAAVSPLHPSHTFPPIKTPSTTTEQSLYQPEPL